MNISSICEGKIKEGKFYVWIRVGKTIVGACENCNSNGAFRARVDKEWEKFENLLMGKTGENHVSKTNDSANKENHCIGKE